MPLPRKRNRTLLRTPGRLRDSVLAAGAVLDRVLAEVAVGFGGYMAVPAYLTAHRHAWRSSSTRRTPQPGVANWLAARMTTHVFTAAPSVRLAHATAIGIPLRPAITGLDRRARRSPAAVRPATRRPRTDGHRQFAGRLGDQRRGSGAAAAVRATGVQVLHITGPQNAVEVPDGDPADPPYVVIPYVDEMQCAYARPTS